VSTGNLTDPYYLIDGMVKLSLCSGTNPLKVCNAPGCWIHVFLTLALNWGEWQLHAPATLPLMKNPPLSLCRRLCGSQQAIKIQLKEKNRGPCQKSNSSHAGHHFTDLGVLVHYLEQIDSRDMMAGCRSGFHI
jgi:hypothetical protein